MPENPASYRVVRTKSYLFNKAVWNMQKAKLHKMVGRVATTGVEAPLTEPVLVMKSFPLATWRGSKIKVMEKLHDRPDKVAKKAIQKGDWRFILSAMAAERRLLRLRMVSPAYI
ncbi:hypothetical protein CWN13_00625 [Klebsiella pneumoniae]|nr:hypothetical protein CWN13_00625 [Klebsiella pneumoniae]